MTIRQIATRYCRFLDRRGKAFNIVVGVVCTALLGFIDYYSDTMTGVDYTLALFYLLPVSFVAWFAGRNAAIAISMVCMLTKMSVQLASEEAISLVIWKNGTSFAFFLLIALLLAKLRHLLDHERLLSRTDHLTGAVNSRAFLEVTTNEIFRLRRHDHPFTIVYIDLDNFKEINDTHDHSAGDYLLQTVVATISQNLRRTDVVARLGGDEFAALLTDTNEKAALVAIHKIREQLQVSMRRHNMGVTFSIGLLTCTVAPQSADEIITLADNLMYEVKRSGKNGIRHAVYVRCDAPVPVQP